MEQGTSGWAKNVSKSISLNQQLDFISNMSVACKNSDGEPAIEQIKLGDILDEQVIISPMDKRARFAQLLVDSPLVELLVYYPLSKEKYKLKSTLGYITSDKVQLPVEYAGDPARLRQVYQEFWQARVGKEEKKSYQEPHPDMVTVEKNKSSDLDKYNALDKSEISHNFMLLLFFPVQVEHTIYAPPQVIADSRKIKFESVMQPYKKNKKYIHTYNKPQKAWSVQALNPW